LLLFVALFLVLFAVSAAAIWLYRKIFAWQGVTHTKLPRPKGEIKTPWGW